MAELDRLKCRCSSLRRLVAHSISPSKISSPCRGTLLRLLDAEFRHLSRLPSNLADAVSSNVGYLEALARVLLHPAVSHASHVCRRVSTPVPAHVDLVCTLFGRAPAWVLVSARNPSHLSWLGENSIRAKVEHFLRAARAGGPLKPASVLLVFARGLSDEISRQLLGEFGAVEIEFFGDSDVLEEELEDGWVGVERWGGRGRVFEIKIEMGRGEERVVELSSKGSGDEGPMGEGEFGTLISSIRRSGGNEVELVNFDTTALVAIVSGISNGGSERLLKAPEVETRERFKSNYEFVIAQVVSELEHPILAELIIAIGGKKGIISESVCSEFKELVSMYGGPNEKLRADRLLRHLLIVPDGPSARIQELPTTRKIAMKNKIVFGTGDHWHAPTLTANMGFVRAVSQTGMSLLTIEHRPRALIGD